MSYFTQKILKQLISRSEWFFPLRQLSVGKLSAGKVLLWRNFLLLSVVVLLSACGNESQTSFKDGSSNSSAAAINIVLSTDSVLLSEVGSQIQLSATLTDSNGVAFIEQPTFVWLSDAENTVVINQTGLLTAKALGQTNVSVSGGGVTKVISVLINSDISILNGQVRYADKEYGSSGFTGRADFYKAVRFAKVDLLAENGVSVVKSTYTDAEGNFTFSGILTSRQAISVYAKTDESQGLNLRVEDRSSSLYAVSKLINLADLDNFKVDIPVSSTAAGAFNILDVFTNAAQFTLANTNLSLVNLAAFWQPGNSDGTYFCTGYDSLYCEQSAGVYVYNTPNGDTDEFDDDVLYHEFGHYFVDALSRDDSYGGCHLLSSKDLDLRLSWSEGLGDFFPAVIKDWLSDSTRKHLLSAASNLPVTAYVDSYGTSAQIYIDMATMDQSRYSSAGSEMAVAKILWGLSQRYGMPAVVKVLTDYLPDLGNSPVNLESFWDGWLAVHNPTAAELLILESIFGERLVFYREDKYEFDDTADSQRKAVLGQLETHYLYSKTSVLDLDIIAFDVQANKQYTLQTSGLTSGADTHIRVFNEAASPLIINGVEQANDDANPDAYYGYDSVCGSSRIKNSSSALASTVSFVAPDTGTYYAEIRTTVDSDPYLSAGRYGTYDFKVIQN